MDTFNFEARIYGLLSLIDHVEKPKNDDNSSPFPINLTGARKPVHLGKLTNIYRYQTDRLGRKINYVKDLKEGGKIQFDNASYKKIIELSEELLTTEPFNLLTNSEFVEEQICHWAFETFINKKASEEPLSFLLRKLNDHSKTINFYFPTIALHIEDDINFINCNIVHVGDKFINSRKKLFRADNNGYSEQYLSSIFQKIDNQILFKVQEIGTEEFAKIKAKNTAKLYASVLKMFLIQEINDKNIRLFDLVFNSVLIPQYDTYVETDRNIFDFGTNISANFGSKPTSLTSKRLLEIKRIGFYEVIEFIDITPTREIDFFIRNQILTAGKYSSLIDPYERNIRMVAWFEAIITQNTNGKSKAISRLKKHFIPKIYNPEEIELVNHIFIKQFQMRDKYLHNGLEIRFDHDLFFKFHYIAIIFLKKIITLSKEVKTQKELISFFEKN